MPSRKALGGDFAPATDKIRQQIDKKKTLRFFIHLGCSDQKYMATVFGDNP
jgi:hypothetical protein